MSICYLSTTNPLASLFVLRRPRRKPLPEVVGDLLRFSVAADDDVHGAPCAEQLAAWELADLVFQSDARPAYLPNADLHLDLVVIPCGRLVAGEGLDQGRVEAPLLDLGVGQANRAQELGPRDFEPHEVLGVMDYPHRVRLSEPRAEPHG